MLKNRCRSGWKVKLASLAGVEEDGALCIQTDTCVHDFGQSMARRCMLVASLPEKQDQFLGLGLNSILISLYHI